jgi:hypothetical protein
MQKVIAWLVLIVGILFLLPLITIDQLGIARDWLIAILVIVIGILLVAKKK